MMTPQDIFNTVAQHLLTQKKRSFGPNPHKPDDEICLYRSPEGCKCAAGVLISDQDYIASMEGKATYAAEVIKAIRNTTGNLEPKAERLIAHLQSLHDNIEVSDWPASLCRSAAKWALDDAVVRAHS